MTDEPQLSLADLARLSDAVTIEVERAIIGKRDAIRLVLAGWLADGHVLIEDLPGLAKTMLARSLAQVTGVEMARIQFTPDLMPADVTGSSIWDPSRSEFQFRPGPIFANLVLGDEINRAPPKTQAAMLEAMAERQVSIDGHTHRLPAPFLVLATQNPVEFEGTYPLPEAQVDRFLLRVGIGYPDEPSEREILRRRIGRRTDEVELSEIVDRPTLLAMQQAIETVHVAEPIIEYVTALVAATRVDSQLQTGASPRGSLALVKLARAVAGLDGRDYVTPDDVQSIAIPALGHRVILRPELWVRGVSGDEVIARILEVVPTPRAEDPLVTGPGRA
ncbi:MAG: AAA family ATPase [Acidimicrobiales bacterium]